MTSPADPASTNSLPTWFLPAVALAVLIPRLIFVLSFPAMEGDGMVYTTVALNILYNGCVSMSDPVLGACAPHWGGNQLPGYPAFIALSWLLTGSWTSAPLVAQAMAYAAAATYVVRALILSGTGTRAVLAATAVLVFSPTFVAWPRMLLTETLALAAALWVLGILIRAFSNSRIPTLELGIAFAIGLFIRYDFVLLAIPVIIAGFTIHRPAEALRRGTVVILIVAIPYGAWTLRSMSADLPPFPPFGLTDEGEQLAPGTLEWMGTWVASPYDLPNSVWPLVTGDYGNIQPPDRAFTDAEERQLVGELLAQLRQIKPGPVPDQVDAAFSDLAALRRGNHTVYLRLGLPLRRAAEMWFSPFPSMGWPAEVGTGRAELMSAVKTRGFGEIAIFVFDSAGPAAAKAIVGGWRLLVIGVLGFVIIANILGRRKDQGLIWLALAYGLVRTGVFASTVLVEARYLLPALMWLEISRALAYFGPNTYGFRDAKSDL